MINEKQRKWDEEFWYYRELRDKILARNEKTIEMAAIGKKPSSKINEGDRATAEAIKTQIKRTRSAGAHYFYEEAELPSEPSAGPTIGDHLQHLRNANFESHALSLRFELGMLRKNHKLPAILPFERRGFGNGYVTLKTTSIVVNPCMAERAILTHLLSTRCINKTATGTLKLFIEFDDFSVTVDEIGPEVATELAEYILDNHVSGDGLLNLGDLYDFSNQGLVVHGAKPKKDKKPKNNKQPQAWSDSDLALTPSGRRTVRATNRPAPPREAFIDEPEHDDDPYDSPDDMTGLFTISSSNTNNAPVTTTNTFNASSFYISGSEPFKM
jgi:hypothetical protein